VKINSIVSVVLLLREDKDINISGGHVAGSKGKLQGFEPLTPNSKLRPIYCKSKGPRSYYFSAGKRVLVPPPFKHSKDTVESKYTIISEKNECPS